MEKAQDILLLGIDETRIRRVSPENLRGLRDMIDRDGEPEDRTRGVLATLGLEGLRVLFAFGVAVLTGITALYIDKPWGSKWDYVTAITWGLGTAAAVATLGAAINRFGETAAFGRGQRGL